MAGVAAATLGFLYFATMRLAAPPMGLLYGGLELDDSASIVEKLDAMAVPYQLQGNGSQIMVPSDQVLRLRMSMAAEGLPSGGSVGYEIFDRSESLGTTSFVQNINRLRALEGEISRTIRTIKGVATTRVHLVLPKREVFRREPQQPTASITVSMRGGNRLTTGQVQAIQHLTAAAVPGLSPSRVSIVDDRGTLLANGIAEEDNVVSATGRLDEMRLDFERRLKKSVEDLLSSIVGPGRARVEVTADLNFDRITTNSETYDPDGQVVRSSQTVEERGSSEENDAQGTVSVANNLPDAEETEQEAGPSNASSSSRTEETVNYEISKTIKQALHESGTVSRVSVAVLVDGNYATDAEGNRTYQPRNEEQLEQIATLVRSAIGFDGERGDRVEVVNMRFIEAETTLEAVEESFFDVIKRDYLRILEIFALVVVGILVLFVAVRPLINRTFATQTAGAGSQAGVPAISGGQPTPQITGENGEPVALPGPEDEAAPEALAASPPAQPAQIQSMIDMAKVEGQVRASSLKKVGEIVNNHPEEAVAIIRTWLYDKR